MKIILLVVQFLLVQTAFFSQDSLIAYLPFNGNATDSTGNGNNGTPFIGTALTTDRFGNKNSAYSFDGVNDYISINNSNIKKSSNATVMFWFSPSDNVTSTSGAQTILQSDIAGDTDGDFLIGLNRSNCFSASDTKDGRLNLEVQGDVTNGNSTVCDKFGLARVGSNITNWTSGEWYHIAVTVGSGNMKIYVNGKLDSAYTTTSSLFVDDQDITIGRYITSQQNTPFAGKIDDLKFFNSDLPDQTIYNSVRDCNGDIDGTALVDNCNVCSGGNTGLFLNECVASIENNTSRAITVFPNPSSGFVSLNILVQSIDVYSIDGTLLDSFKETDRFDLSELDKGIYILKINSQGTESITKILKK